MKKMIAACVFLVALAGSAAMAEDVFILPGSDDNMKYMFITDDRGNERTATAVRGLGNTWFVNDGEGNTTMVQDLSIPLGGERDRD
jgi:hypothetical protein